MTREDVKKIFPEATDEQITAFLNQSNSDVAREKAKVQKMKDETAQQQLAFKKEIEEKCTKIDVLSDEIDSNLKQCLELKDKKQCSSCFAEIEKDVKFCPKCGAKQEEVKKEPAKEVEVIEKSNNPFDGNDVVNNETEESQQTENEEKSNLEETVTVESDPKLEDDKTVEHISEEE